MEGGKESVKKNLGERGPWAPILKMRLRSQILIFHSNSISHRMFHNLNGGRRGGGALNIFEFNNMGISKGILLHHTVSDDTFKNI